jgi:Transposase DNA-binding/Transposase DDE domain
MTQKFGESKFVSNFGDARLDQRFQKIVSVSLKEYDSSIPQAFKKNSQIKATYRFLNNSKVNSERILASQFSGSTDSFESIVLAVHDTTELDFTGKKSSKQLGSLSFLKRKGILLHNTLLLTEKGIPTSVFDQYFWTRSADTLGKKKQRKHSPIEQKESARWINGIEKVNKFFLDKPANMVINICDREGDIYELLQVERPTNCHYLIRSCNNRLVNPKDSQEKKIWDSVGSTPLQGSYTLEITDQKTGEKRDATIGIKILHSVELTPPYRKNSKLKPIEVNIICAKEINPPNDIAAIDWKLLTSLPIENVDKALTLINYYSSRWRIERFHYVLKQGCAVEDLQLEQEHNLKNAISLYSIVACQILAMLYLSRENPKAPISTVGYTSKQYHWLHTYLQKAYNFKFEKELLENATIENFILLVGILGGYQRHNKPHPGVKLIWKGLKEFTTILNCMEIIHK